MYIYFVFLSNFGRKYFHRIQPSDTCNFSPDEGLRGEDLVHAGGDDDVLLPEEPLLVPRPVHQPEVTGNRIIKAVTAVTKLSYKLSPEIESSQDRKQNYYLLMPALLWSNSAALKHLNL